LAEDKYEAKIGLQLYSIRRVIEKEFKSSIEKVARMGYYGIETYALPKNITLKEAANIFRENKLEIFSIHTKLPIGDDRDLALRMADAYHCDRFVYHSWPPGDKYKNKAALDHTVEMYVEIASFLFRRYIIRSVIPSSFDSLSTVLSPVLNIFSTSSRNSLLYFLLLFISINTSFKVI
jgi:hypothetical protein